MHREEKPSLYTSRPDPRQEIKKGTGRWASASVGTDCRGKGALHDYALRCRVEANAAVVLDANIALITALHGRHRHCQLSPGGLPVPSQHNTSGESTFIS
ncbi:hypothetical protein Anapl_10597 [Anas platyrhynchos]|uniref:Uncharacterized protein n=1 Tax=Anas platyrhynchos TaxID=8839 RepID=R0JDE0_ANAPL|nr:hypothetical protein Anapl_10597 [Anas platyrhynchos]